MCHKGYTDAACAAPNCLLERGLNGHLSLYLDGQSTLISCLIGILELFRPD